MDIRLEPPAWATELLSDLTDMDRGAQPLEAGAGPIEYALPADAYFEYAYRDAEGRVRADPDNPERGVSPWFPEVSALYGPAYRPDPLAAPDEALERGTTDRLRFESQALGELRRATVYTPQGYEGAALPLVVVQDGVAFYRLGRVHLVAEALLAEGAIRPARFVFVEPRDRQAEYGFAPAYRRFLLEELLPLMDRDYPATGERVWLGASLGGLVSATLALEHPEVADAVVSFSGAFLGAPDEREYYRTERSWLLERLRAGATPPRRWYLEVGTLEWLLDVNRQVRAELERLGAQHAYAERNAGHNWTNWKNGMSAALRYVLGA